MRRVLFVLLICVFVTAGCGGTPPDTTVADPPKATVFQNGDNTKINQLVEEWKNAVPTEMKNQQIKAETIEEKVYQSNASLQEIADFYKTLTTKGWSEVAKMPGLQGDVLLSGYEIGGNTTFVVNAVNEASLGGDGVLIYTVKGHK